MTFFERRPLPKQKSRFGAKAARAYNGGMKQFIYFLLFLALPSGAVWAGDLEKVCLASVYSPLVLKVERLAKESGRRSNLCSTRRAKDKLEIDLIEAKQHYNECVELKNPVFTFLYLLKGEAEKSSERGEEKFSKARDKILSTFNSSIFKKYKGKGDCAKNLYELIVNNPSLFQGEPKSSCKRIFDILNDFHRLCRESI